MQELKLCTKAFWASLSGTTLSGPISSHLRSGWQFFFADTGTFACTQLWQRHVKDFRKRELHLQQSGACWAHGLCGMSTADWVRPLLPGEHVTAGHLWDASPRHVSFVAGYFPDLSHIVAAIWWPSGISIVGNFPTLLVKLTFQEKKTKLFQINLSQSYPAVSHRSSTPLVWLVSARLQAPS